MTASSLVGVVVAAYDAERHLGAALGSLSRQTHPGWVAVVVDDGSTDATAAVAAAAAGEDARVRLHRQANAGVGAARNAGLAALPEQAEYVCFLDSDDLLLPDALATLISALDGRPDATAATGWADTIDEWGQPVDAGVHRATQSNRLVGRGLGTRTLESGEDTTFASLAVHGTIWPPATALARRRVVAELGGFDEALPSQEDWDLFLRMSRRGPIVFVDQQVAWYRRHDGNASRHLTTNRYCANVVRRKAWTAPDSTPRQRRCVLAASLRLRGWEAGNELRAAAADLRAGRRGRYAGDARRLAFRLGQLAHLRPPVPSRSRLERLERLTAREDRPEDPRASGTATPPTSAGGQGAGEGLVGVVVAAYQAAHHLGAALESVAAQTHDRVVAVVVDDGSTDPTGAVADAFAARDGRFSVLRQANAGVSAARNAGLAALPEQAEYVCFLDADDVLLPDALASLSAALEARPDAPAASGWAERVDGEGRPVQPGVQRALQSRRPVGAGLHCRLLGPAEDTTFETLLLHGSVSPPATALVRRDVAEGVGGFAAELTCHEDGDFWVRVARTGPLVYLDRQIAWYRQHDTNLTGATATCLWMGYVMRRRAWSSPANTAAQRRAVLAANLRTRSWEMARTGRRIREGARTGRPAAVGWGVARALAGAAEMVALRPVVPPRRWTELAVRMDARCGFDPSGRW